MFLPSGLAATPYAPSRPFGGLFVRLVPGTRNGEGGRLAGHTRLKTTELWFGSLVESVSVAVRSPTSLGWQTALIVCAGPPSAIDGKAPATWKSERFCPLTMAEFTFSGASPVSKTLMVAVYAAPTAVDGNEMGPGAAGVEPKPAAGAAVP